jgi:hypothetical protein
VSEDRLDVRHTGARFHQPRREGVAGLVSRVTLEASPGPTRSSF